MYVSRGIGTSWLPLRFRAVPEVVMLTLRAGGEPARPRRLAETVR
jgi:hypothetical protein